MPRKEYVPLGRLAERAAMPGADLYLVKPGRGAFSDFELIRFSTRNALESFNVRANLSALVKTRVPKGCALYRHQTEG